MAIKEKIKKQKGLLIIEILIVIAIITIALTSLLGTATFSLKNSISLKENTIAEKVAEETLEIVRNFRDGTTWTTNGLGTLTLDSAYHPVKTTDIPPKWSLVSGEDIVDGFTRKVIFKKVFRDTNDNIATTGTEDPNTKKVIATVSWKGKTVELTAYLTNWK